MLTLIALCASADEIESTEIGGVNDRRRSNPAGFRSRLTFRSLLQQFPPIRGLLVCDDTAVRQNSRLSSAPFVGAPQETSHTPWTSWPQEPESPTLRLSPVMASGMAPVPSWQRRRKRATTRVHSHAPTGGLSSQPLITSRVKPCTNERDRPFLPPGRGGLLP